MADYTSSSINTLSTPTALPVSIRDVSAVSDDLISGSGSITYMYKMRGKVSGSWTTWVSTGSPTPISGATDVQIMEVWVV